MVFTFFEGISGLTINLAKSELVPLNLDEATWSYYANLLFFREIIY
jgi:hypothetical protein